MTFFYDLNKRLNNITQLETLTEGVVAEKYMGFDKTVKAIEKGGSARDPEAVAAAIGRKKYGKEKFQKAAAAGKKLGEKIEPAIKTDPSERGKYKGKDVSELKSELSRVKKQMASYRDRGEKVPHDVRGKFSELTFAIRAKQAGGGKWKAIKEEPNEGNEFSGELAKAKASGAKEFKVDGKTYPVKESELDEGYVDFHDKKIMYKKQGADVDGKPDDYTVTFKDGTRKRYQELDGRRRVTTLEPIERNDAVDDEGEVVKRGRGRPKGTGRKIGTRGVTDVRAKKKKVAEATGNLGSIIRANQRDVDAFMRSGDLSDSLYDALYDYYMDEMPYGTAKARTGDPYEWISDRFYDDMGGGIKEDYDQDEYDEEGEMAKSQSRTIADAAQELQDMISDDENLPEWVQKKITLAQNYIDSARDYLKSNRPGSEEEMDVEVVGEKAVSKAQRAAAGIAYAAKKGDIPKSELRGASKEMAKMASGELKKFAKTKEKGLPEKVREEDTETRDERAEKAGKKVAKDIEYDEKVKDKIHGKKRGSEDSKAEKAGKKVTKDIEHDEKVDETADEAPKGKSGGMQFGKGIYDSVNRQVEEIIAESMSINVSDSTEGGKSMTITATDEDAVKLAALVKMAGIGSESDDSCPACGKAPCGCETMEEAYGDTDATENKPDYPTNTETSDDALQYSGGLNKPKSTGQTTGAPFNADPARRGVMHDEEISRLREMAGISEAKPDFLDVDKDGDKEEDFEKAVKDKEEKEQDKVDESTVSSLWDLYKRIA